MSLGSKTATSVEKLSNFVGTTSCVTPVSKPPPLRAIPHLGYTLKHT